jgi:hypothetical protein
VPGKEGKSAFAFLPTHQDAALMELLATMEQIAMNILLLPSTDRFRVQSTSALS